jgi:hypothetical protein
MKVVSVAFLTSLLVLSAVSQTREFVVVQTLRANLRGTPSTNGPVVTEVSRGERFAVISRQGRWILVQTPEYTGWIHQSVVTTTQPQIPRVANRNPPTEVRPVRTIEPLEPVNPNRLPIGSSPLGSGIRSGHSSLSVVNGTDNDALVRVIRVGVYEQLVRNFYVPANRTFTAEELPAGSYVMRVAFGRDWNETQKRFNFRRSFTETQQFQVTERVSSEQVSGGRRITTHYSKISITLHKVTDGNFASKQISEEDFWALDN